MNYTRIVTVVGVVLAVIGLFIKKASSDAEQYLSALHEAVPDIPSSLDENVWSALYNDTAWAAIVFALAIVGALICAFSPPMAEAMKRMYGLAATVLGVVMLVIGGFATVGAMDDADTLSKGLAAMAEAGALPQAFTVTIGFGWYLLIIGGVVVAIGGVLSLISRPDDNALDLEDDTATA